jgi:hypothetical protein
MRIMEGESFNIVIQFRRGITDENLIGDDKFDKILNRMSVISIYP